MHRMVAAFLIGACLVAVMAAMPDDTASQKAWRDIVLAIGLGLILGTFVIGALEALL
jgi:hypothetical protein